MVDKNTSARLSAKNAGGLMSEGGRICGTLRYMYPQMELGRNGKTSVFVKACSSDVEWGMSVDLVLENVYHIMPAS